MQFIEYCTKSEKVVIWVQKGSKCIADSPYDHVADWESGIRSIVLYITSSKRL